MSSDGSLGQHPANPASAGTDASAALAAFQHQAFLLDAVAATTPDFLYVFDRGGRFLYANRRLLEVWGRKLEDIVGKTCLELGYEPWHHEMHMREIAEVIQTRKPIKGEVPFTAPLTGIHGVYDYIFTPVFDADGNVQAVSGITRDVTERKQAEAALRASEARFRAMTLSTADVVYAFNADWSVLQPLDGRGLIITHIEPLLNWSWLTVHIPPHEQERVRAAVEKAIATKQPYDLEHQVNRPDGTLGWTSSRAVPILDVQGEIVEWFGVAADITDRKRAEAELAETRRRAEAALQAGAVGTYFWDPVKDRISGDRNFVKLFGVLRDEHDSAPLGDLLHVIHPDDLPGVTKQVQHTLDTGQPYHAQYRVRGMAGERWVDAYGNVERDAAGEVSGWSGVLIDITARKRAEQQLASNQQVFYELVERCPFGIYVVDADFRIATMNAGSVDKTFPNVRPIIGRPFEEAMRILWPEPVAMEIVSIFRRTLETGEAYYSRDFVRPRADRQAVEGYEWELHRIAMPDGRFGVVCYFYDSTELRQAQDRLHESRERMELVVKGADVGVWYCPLPFDKLIWDETVKRHFHLPPTTDVTIELFYDRIHPDDRARTRAAIEKSIAEKGSYDIDYRTVSFDGERTNWIRASGRGFYDANGDPIRFDGITIDMTERVRNAEALRASEALLLEAQRLGHIGSWYWDVATDKTIGSDELFRIFGLDRATQEFPLFSEQDGSLYPHDSWRRIQDAIQAALQTGEGFELDVEAYRQGESIWVTTRCEVMRAPDGQPVGLRGTVLDITERKKAESEREKLLDSERAARTQAERTSRMKDEFLATLSHELRTPMNAMLGWTEILRRTSPTPAEYEEGLAVIERNCRNQAQLIEDLLDMSRIVSGKIRLDVRPVQMADVVRAAADVVRPAADARSVHLKLSLPKQTADVTGDAARLQQVLWNLLSNAIKFTPAGGIVQVVLRNLGDELEIAVADTGQGIRPEFLPYVFERFRQEDGSITRQHGGLGLGLSIVKNLVELHGGKVRVESRGQNRGATFFFTLPVMSRLAGSQANAVPVSAVPGTSAGPAKWGRTRLTGVKVLVVDDDADARELLRRMLGQVGAIVTLAGSASEALTALTTDRPTLLLSDIGMPKVDGYELIRRVRQLPGAVGQLPAVAITAFARSEDRRLALDAGYQAHLAKPFNPDELVTVCAKMAGVEVGNEA